MPRRKRNHFKKPCRVVGAFDTETSTYRPHKDLRSLPVCYQLCYTNGVSVEDIEDFHALDVKVYRFQSQLISAFSPIIRDGLQNDYTPVIAVHNLGYDLRFLMDYLEFCANEGYNITCCFKSSIKPLSVTINRGYEPILILWDTLTFSGMSLENMGLQCGHAKAVGDWNHNIQRHPETNLTESELNYACEDCRALLAWLSFWCKLNPDIPPYMLAKRVLTKTSVVRYKCREIASRLKIPTGGKRASTVYNDYLNTCYQELPTNEQSYNLMIRATSAGWTFTASRGAGVAWDNVFKYDANSMHPSHMVSHYYPRSFEIVTDREKMHFILSTCFAQTVENILNAWEKPFPFAFNARVKFSNIRLKQNSIFFRDGIALHGRGLFSNYETRFADLDDEASNREFNAINDAGYNNYASNPSYLFGKLIAADELIITLNEINAWVHFQVYEWDSFDVLEMSASANFKRPPTYVYVCVSEMLKRKSTVKRMMKGEVLEREKWIPESAYTAIYEDSESATAKAYYMSVKADLNSLYGMFATNEFKESIIYDDYENTFCYDGKRGIANAPKKPKAWYQFGMRIAAFSRLQQCIALMLLDDANLIHCTINGDTDSLAFQGKETCTHDEVAFALAPLHDAISRSIEFCAGNVHHVSTLDFLGLGQYTIDCEPDLYCAVANKRYAYLTDNKTVIHVASAGVPTRSIRRALSYELENDVSFSEAVIKTLGYEVSYEGILSGTKARSIPEWNERLNTPFIVEDYNGDLYEYPANTCTGIALVNTSKQLGAGFDSDYAWVCSNAGILPISARHYELVTDDNDNEIIGVW